MCPCRAALAIGQKRAPGIARPAGERAEEVVAAAVVFRRRAELEDGIEMTAAEARPAQAGLRSHHPGPELKVVAGLAAADDPARAGRAHVAAPAVQPAG